MFLSFKLDNTFILAKFKPLAELLFIFENVDVISEWDSHVLYQLTCTENN